MFKLSRVHCVDLRDRLCFTFCIGKKGVGSQNEAFASGPTVYKIPVIYFPGPYRDTQEAVGESDHGRKRNNQLRRTIQAPYILPAGTWRENDFQQSESLLVKGWALVPLDRLPQTPDLAMLEHWLRRFGLTGDDGELAACDDTRHLSRKVSR